MLVARKDLSLFCVARKDLTLFFLFFVHGCLSSPLGINDRQLHSFNYSLFVYELSYF